jgi:membrane associated rhomboid family serine protease
VRTRATIWNARQLTLVTYVIMALNVGVFLWVTLKDPGTISGRSTVSTQQCELGLSKFLVRYPGLCSDAPHVASTSGYEWYRLVSAGFLHFGILHIAFNMLLLFQLGQLLERAVGRTQFVLLYVAALLGGSLGVLIIDSSGITGGASGAVFGLLAAAAVGLHRRGVNVFSTGIGTTLLLNLFLTFAIPGISIGGHIGGAVAGAVCGFVMLAPRWKPLPRWTAYATPVAVAVASVIASVLVVG